MTEDEKKSFSARRSAEKHSQESDSGKGPKSEQRQFESRSGSGRKSQKRQYRSQIPQYTSQIPRKQDAEDPEDTSANDNR